MEWIVPIIIVVVLALFMIPWVHRDMTRDDIYKSRSQAEKDWDDENGF